MLRGPTRVPCSLQPPEAAQSASASFGSWQFPHELVPLRVLLVMSDSPASPQLFAPISSTDHAVAVSLHRDNDSLAFHKSSTARARTQNIPEIAASSAAIAALAIEPYDPPVFLVLF